MYVHTHRHCVEYISTPQCHYIYFDPVISAYIKGSQATLHPLSTDVWCISGFWLVANHVVEMDLKGHVTIYTANAVMTKQGAHSA